MIRFLSEFVDLTGILVMRYAYRDRALALNRGTVEARLARLPTDPHGLFGQPVAPFDLPRAVVGETVRHGLRWITLAYPSPKPSGIPVNDTVRVEWVRARRLTRHDPPRPILVTVPGYRQHTWGDVFLPLAHYMVRHGWDMAFCELPYHFSRRPRTYEHGELLISSDPATTLLGLSQAVLDVRAALSTFHAAGFPRVGLLGISLGGLIAALTSLVDDAPDRLLLVEPVLDPVDAVWNCRLIADKRKAMRRLAYTEADIRRILAPVSPACHASALGPEQILILSPRYDLIARKHAIDAARRRWGRPRQIEMAAGHFLFAVLCLRLLPRMLSFLNDTTVIAGGRDTNHPILTD